MITNKNIKKLIFLKNIVSKKNENKIKLILKSITRNNEINELKKSWFNLKIKKVYNRKSKKNCLSGISNKWVNKKSKFSRFFISYINRNNLNQNFRIYEK